MAYYQAEEPAKANDDNVKKILTKYSGKEDEMIENLEKKYSKPFPAYDKGTAPATILSPSIPSGPASTLNTAFAPTSNGAENKSIGASSPSPFAPASSSSPFAP